MPRKDDRKRLPRDTPSLTVASSEAPLRFSPATLERIVEANTEHTARMKVLRPAGAASAGR